MPNEGSASVASDNALSVSPTTAAVDENIAAAVRVNTQAASSMSTKYARDRQWPGLKLVFLYYGTCDNFLPVQAERCSKKRGG
jgi:hypothetical protein